MVSCASREEDCLCLTCADRKRCPEYRYNCMRRRNCFTMGNRKKMHKVLECSQSFTHWGVLVKSQQVTK
jgi:hypothetical protein